MKKGSYLAEVEWASIHIPLDPLLGHCLPDLAVQIQQLNGCTIGSAWVIGV